MAKVKKHFAPDHLTMRLFAPGMSVLHRAGLGGLACTLRYIEEGSNQGILLDDEVPRGGWEIEDQAITLSFGDPQDASDFLTKLFKIAFQIKDGLIYLPGQYLQEPSLAVRAELQMGLTLTFLQHGKTRNLEKDATTCQIDPEGDGRSLVTIEYKRCSWYKHQDGWEELADQATGELQSRPVEIIGPLNPGAVIRHVAFSKATKIEDIAERILPLYFALVGCLALPINRGVGVLIAPEVDNLHAFCTDRPAMTPTSSRECRIAGTGDAALQTLIRLRSRGYVESLRLPGCHAARFRPTSWASQQKSRVETLVEVCRESMRMEPENPGLDDLRLDLFAFALAELRPRVWVPNDERKAKKRRKPAKTKDHKGPAWIDSVVRPFIADNLALGKDWFDDFHRLMYHTKLRKAVRYEKEGLHAMTEHMKDQGYEREAALVRAIHEAISFARRRIKKETQGDTKAKSTDATLNRQERFMERVRLDLINAKTADDAQTAICKLLRNTPYDNGLHNDAWMTVLPLLTDRDLWKKARNLALVAVASWGGNRAEVTEQIEPNVTLAE